MNKPVTFGEVLSIAFVFFLFTMFALYTCTHDLEQDIMKAIQPCSTQQIINK